MTGFMTARSGVILLVLMLSACGQPRNVEAPPSRTHFRNVEDVAVASLTGLAPVLVNGRLVTPKFPPNLKVRELQNNSVVAYVVDTTGVIEGLVFLNSTPAEFRRAICDWTRVARFEPLYVRGRITRGLTVSSFGFYLGPVLPVGRPPDESPQWRSKIAGMSTAELSTLLESRPRC